MDPAAIGGPSYWQVGAALAAVLGLVVVALKALQRLQGGGDQDAEVRLLSVRRLGPRRELQRLRVGDRVHTIYRHDGAMVVLRDDPWTPATVAETTPAPDAAAALGTRLRTLVASAGGRVREATGR
jgi:flagellar biogenesis protein FliO